MRSKLTLAIMLTVALVAPAALPCGAPFGNGINVDPRQDIVVVHKEGVETYVFQPRFCGSAQEFGLVLPVPAKLAAQPKLAKAEIFTTLVEMSQPKIEYSTACGNRGWGGSTGTAGGTGGSGTTVVSSGTVGFMDYAQLDTASLDALTSWLAANGYPYDAQATSTFDYYVQKGWYFLTFKVSQGTIPSTSVTCKDLGPVKFSFPSEVPVVPTRMATARSKDPSGVLSYASSFSWRVFGITPGSKELRASGYSRNFSGLVDASAVAGLDGLAVAGDRATKLTITFSYGSTAPDVPFSLVEGQDYREVERRVSYITCTDGGANDPVDAPPDEGIRDAGGMADTATAAGDTATSPPEVPSEVDAGSGPVVPDDAATPDLAAVVLEDAATTGKLDAVAIKRDGAAAVKSDAAASGDAQPAEGPSEKHAGGGCSFGTLAGAGELLPALFALALLAGLRRRRR